MTTYRAYICTLHAPGLRDVFWLRRFSEMRSLLEYFAAQLCGTSPCEHPGDVRLVLDRVWLADGFLCDRPTEFTSVPDQLSHVCPRALLEAL